MKFSYFNKPISNTVPCRVATLLEIHQLISGNHYVFETKQIRVTNNAKQKKIKSENLDYVTFSGVFSRRGEKYLETHSGLLTLDFDDISDVGKLKEQILNDKLLITGLLFRSPSGNGLKCIVPIDLNEGSHNEWFQAISNYVKEQYGKSVDPSGKDVARACFLCHDPEAYLNPAFNNNPSTLVHQTLNLRDWLVSDITIEKDVPDELQAPTSENSLNNTFDDVRNVVKAIEQRQIDLTDTYSSWRDIGFALADNLGEQGRNFYHRISRFYADYDSNECDKQYDNCMKSNGSGITIRSLFYHAAKAGVEITSVSIPKKTRKQLPIIPESVYKTLPDFFKTITAQGKNTIEKDILLLGSVATLSSSLEKFYGVYDGKKVFSNLYFFLEGMAGSGKSILNHCRQLIDPIHNDLMLKSKKEEAKYKIDFARYKEEKKENSALEPPVPPTKKMLIFPANISSAGMLQLLNDNDGKGIIFETEGDTLAETFNNKEFGNFSDSFRKAFHHEPISSYRKTNNELFEVPNPQLSAVLSGTPIQIHNLIPNAENGLASRMMYYSIPMDTSWKNVFASFGTVNLEQRFDGFGQEFFHLFGTMLETENVEFRFTHSQGMELNRIFEQRQSQYSELLGKDFIGFIRRLALISFRISMIFSAIRFLTGELKDRPIICLDDDFSNAMKIVHVLLEHSVSIFSGLPSTPVVKKRENKKEMFFRLLPEEFNRQKYLQVAESIDLVSKTAEGYIAKFNKSGLIHHFDHNLYHKVA